MHEELAQEEVFHTRHRRRGLRQRLARSDILRTPTEGTGHVVSKSAQLQCEIANHLRTNTTAILCDNSVYE